MICFESFFEDEFPPDLELLVPGLLLRLKLLLFLPLLIQIELEVGLFVPLHFEEFLIFVRMLHHDFGHHLKLFLLIELLVRLLHERYLLSERDLRRHHVGCASVLEILQSLFLGLHLLFLDVVELAVHQEVIV